MDVLMIDNSVIDRDDVKSQDSTCNDDEYKDEGKMDKQRDHKNLQENDQYDEDAELEHFDKIVDAFLYYKVHSLGRLQKELTAFRRLPVHHQQLLNSYVEHLDEIRRCIRVNCTLLKQIAKQAGAMFENGRRTSESVECQNRQKRYLVASDFHMDKLQSTLRQFVRDWAEEGREERNKCYEPILADIKRVYPLDRANVKILVPGAGLGRLAFEISRLGYACEGNEFSLFMLFSSHFILNCCPSAEAYTIHPYIHQLTNNVTYADQIRPIRIPDVDPLDSLTSSTGDDGSSGSFSMSAGDFLQVYKNASNEWDCVATVFFLDTARNVVSYVETIFKLLKPGGHWFNLGPLLYHYADMPDEDSVQVPYETLKHVVRTIGFEMLQEEIGVQTTYTQNVRNMLKYNYECVKFICRKPV